MRQYFLSLYPTIFKEFTCLNGQQVCDAVQVRQAVAVRRLGLGLSLDGSDQLLLLDRLVLHQDDPLLAPLSSTVVNLALHRIYESPRRIFYRGDRTWL